MVPSTLPRPAVSAPLERASTLATRQRAIAIGAAAASVFGVATIAVGPLVRNAIPDAGLHAFPFAGAWVIASTHRALPALALAAATAVAYWIATSRLRWPIALWASAPAAAAWAVALGLVRGPAALSGSLLSRFDYLAVVPLGSRRSFISGFVEQLPSLPTHVKSHPPGVPLLFDLLHSVGLRGPGWAAAACIATGAAAAPAVLLAVERLAGREIARHASPFVVAAPFALWVATSADAIFMGVSAWGIAAAVLAATSPDKPRAGAWAALSGLLFGVALMLSYGLALVVTVVGGALILTRRATVAAVIGGACAAVVAAAAGLGFVWWAGLAAARDAYHAGIADARPYAIFATTNLAVVALATGPAMAAGVAGLRHRRLWLVAGAALLAVAFADLSGLSKGEVERIWLPFFPWLMPAAACLDRGERWMAGQIVTTAALALALRSPW